MGSWLQHVRSLQPAVSKRLAACLKEKDALKSGALAAILQVGSGFDHESTAYCCNLMDNIDLCRLVPVHHAKVFTLGNRPSWTSIKADVNACDRIAAFWDD